MGSLIDSCKNKMDELNKNLGGEIDGWADGWMDRQKDGYRET